MTDIISKLNSFILPDNVVKKMKDKVEESRIKNLEVGFNLCSDNHQLHNESSCIGTRCSVDIPKGCSKGRHVGLFHTHPYSSSEPSIQDIANAYTIGINCIGSTEEEDIKCYIRKDKDYNREHLKNIFAAIIRYEDPLCVPVIDTNNYISWIKVRNEIKKQYLNTISIK